MPRAVVEHREAAKDLRKLPLDVRDTFSIVRSALIAEGTTPRYREQILCTSKPRRVLHIAGAVQRGVHYRMAWETRGERVVIWMYGAHEGFYEALKRRARCGR